MVPHFDYVYIGFILEFMFVYLRSVPFYWAFFLTKLGEVDRLERGEKNQTHPASDIISCLCCIFNEF